jgi:hypothetical protein
MPYKIVDAPAASYAEVPQLNPIRWEIVYKRGLTLYLQTQKFMCKDFFNDIVATKKGHAFHIYGFNTGSITTNRLGVWVRVSNIQDYQQFVTNIDKTLNVFYVGEAPLIKVEQLDDTTALMYIPNHFFSNTYKISLTTYVIRLCNYGQTFESFKEALRSLPSENDNPLQTSGKTLALAWMLDVPKEYENFWYWAGKEYNSVKNPAPFAAIIHNNGVHAWAVGGAK